MQTNLFNGLVMQTVVFTLNTLDPQVKPEDDKEKNRARMTPILLSIREMPALFME